MAGPPRNLTWGDFNGDGKTDVAFTLPGGAGFVMLGNGDGTFQTARPIAGLTSISSLAAGDLNGDGKLDLAAAGCALPSCPPDGPWLYTMLGNGDGTFQAPVAYKNATYAQAVAIGDIDGDGKLDVAVGRSVGSVPVLLGNGDGTLRYSQFWPISDLPTTTLTTNAITIVDTNKDGKQDLVVFWSVPPLATISVLRGLGDGNFMTPLTQPYPYIPQQVALADFNRDGVPDIATNGTEKGLPGGGRVAILLGSGFGPFGAPTYPDYPTTFEPATFAVGDLNGDGNPDLVVRAGSATSLSILSGSGDGTFLPAQAFPLSTSGSVNSVIDLNGDGRPDVVVRTATGIAVLLQN